MHPPVALVLHMQEQSTATNEHSEFAKCTAMTGVPICLSGLPGDLPTNLTSIDRIVHSDRCMHMHWQCNSNLALIAEAAKQG